MSNVIGARAPGWLRPVALVALLWNLVGVAFYLGHVGILGGPFVPPPSESAMPIWVTAAYAVGVFAGAVGTLGLAFLQSWSRPVLWLSLLALIVDWGWIMLASGAGIQPLGIVVLVVAALLVWVASTAEKRGWMD